MEPLGSAAVVTGAQVVWQRTDVTRDEDVTGLMDLALQRSGAVHVVLPFAGNFRDAFLVRVKEGKVARAMASEAFRSVLEVNVTGTFRALREALVRRIDGGHGGVAFTVSSISKVGERGQINYPASKAAVASWPKLLVGELFAQGVGGIRVVGLAPGYVDAPILRHRRPEAREHVWARVPGGRFIRSEEVASLVLHVVENEALDVTTVEIAAGALASGLPK